MRAATLYPWRGSRLSVLRTRRSSIPWSASGLFVFRLIPRTLGYALVEAMSRSRFPTEAASSSGSSRTGDRYSHTHEEVEYRRSAAGNVGLDRVLSPKQSQYEAPTGQSGLVLKPTT